MSAFTTSPGRRTTDNAAEAAFTQLLPSIVRHARIAFRYLDDEAKEDAVTEVIANCFVAYKRLLELGKSDLVYPSVLARYAVAQVRSGRRVGNRQNSNDVLNGRTSGRCVERIQRFDDLRGEWSEAIVEDRSTPIPDQAAFRCDFPEWLKRQPARIRRIVEALSMGYLTSEVARRFNVSASRISQLRVELRHSWQAFHGEAVGNYASARTRVALS